MSYLIANAFLQIVNLGVFLAYGGLESLKWALAFGVLILFLPSNTFVLNKNSVLASGAVLLALRAGLSFPQAFICGVLAIWPFSLLGIVPNPVAPSVVLPAAFTALVSYFGLSPLHAYLFGSFVVTKIYLLMFFSNRYMERAPTPSSVPSVSAGRRPFAPDRRRI